MQIRLFKISNRQGFSLVELVVAMAIGLALVMIGARIMNLVDRSNKEFEQLSGRGEIINYIRKNIDCDATFAAAGISQTNPGSFCDSTSATNGQSLVNTMRLKGFKTSVYDLTPSYSSGVGDLFGWKVRTTCSSAEQTLVIRIAQLDASNNPKKTAYREKNLGYDDDDALIFGSSQQGAVPLCFKPKTNNATSMASSLNITTEVPLVRYFHTTSGQKNIMLRPGTSGWTTINHNMWTIVDLSPYVSSHAEGVYLHGCVNMGGVAVASVGRARRNADALAANEFNPISSGNVHADLYCYDIPTFAGFDDVKQCVSCGTILAPLDQDRTIAVFFDRTWNPGGNNMDGFWLSLIGGY